MAGHQENHQGSYKGTYTAPGFKEEKGEQPKDGGVNVLLGIRRRARGLSCGNNGYGMATVAMTCCWRLAGLEPSLYVLTKLEMFVESLVVLPK
jgi:hypothetical protein